MHALAADCGSRRAVQHHRAHIASVLAEHGAFDERPTTSVGRLFDTVAALLGFTREVTYEGQAAIWLEQLAMQSPRADALSMPFVAGELDFRPALIAIVEARCKGRGISEIARSFHSGLARGVTLAIGDLAEEHGARTAVLSGGVFQNDLLLSEVLENLRGTRIAVWTNRLVPANDGGLSLGQAALSAYHSTTTDD